MTANVTPFPSASDRAAADPQAAARPDPLGDLVGDPVGDPLGDPLAALATTTRLVDEARGLAFDVSRLDADFARLYPEQFGAAMSRDDMLRDARERWTQSLESLRTTVRVQAQAVQNLRVDEGVLADIVAHSQSAVGALQAQQATNQLLALQAKQSIQTQRLQLTQDRAVSLEQARQAAATERGREITRRFLGSGTPYTPHPVDFYNR